MNRRIDADGAVRAGDSLVLAAAFPNDVSAHIARGALDAEGIEAVIDNEIFGSLLPIGFNGIGQVRLMVRRRDLGRAREVLRRDGDEG